MCYMDHGKVELIAFIVLGFCHWGEGLKYQQIIADKFGQILSTVFYEGILML
jgi:hypothetical protein